MNDAQAEISTVSHLYGNYSPPEVELWTAVLVQCVDDMKGSLKAVKRHRECSAEMIADAKDAAQYVLSGRIEVITLQLSMPGVIPTLRYLAMTVMRTFQ